MQGLYWNNNRDVRWKPPKSLQRRVKPRTTTRWLIKENWYLSLLLTRVMKNPNPTACRVDQTQK
jgi:hypothetical protein